MTDSERFETIESKLAHLERSLQELGQIVMEQRREIVLLASHNRALQQQVQELENVGSSGPDAFEKPPHY